MPDLTSQELIDQFNKAAGLAREERYEEALEEWNRLLEPSEEEKAKREKEGKKYAMSGEFLGTALMRKAWVLMDLKRYNEAIEVFEDRVMEACLEQLPVETLYEYFFSYGNTLGHLGNIEKMDPNLSKALHIAARELHDAKRCLDCWQNILKYAFKAEAWEYLEGASANAKDFGVVIGLEHIQLEAEWWHIQALKGLGRTEEAKKDAEELLDRLRKETKDDESIEMIEKFIEELDT